MKYGKDVKFEGGKYFSGAIDIDWYFSDLEKSKVVSESYLFHGKKYHSANTMNGMGVGQKLTDSITMIEELLDGFEDNSNHTILSIAGYGAGKTHLALSVSLLLSNIQNNRGSIIEQIKKIDSEAALRIEERLSSDSRSYLVVPINGMREQPLKDLMFFNTSKVLDFYKCSKECLNSFNPQFEFVRQMVLNLSSDKMNTFFRLSNVSDKRDFNERIDSYDENFLEQASSILKNMGMQVFTVAVNGELKDLIPTIANSLCGAGKPFRGLIIVFDEFGKYMSFAAGNEDKAGTGVMQQLFEGINSVKKDSPVLLWGLSQLDLKEYQRTNQNTNFTNNMSRYVTRFDSAKRFYLSICFEAIIANLIYKEDMPDAIKAPTKGKSPNEVIIKYFPSAKNYPVWNDNKIFYSIIRQGCWPLSALAVWTLSFVTSVNNILQQRSGFNILSNVFSFYEGQEVEISDKKLFPIRAIDLYDAGLGDEFVNSEINYRSSSRIANEYKAVLDRYGHQLNENEIKVLQAVVLTHKLSAYCISEEDSKKIIEALSGLGSTAVSKSIDNLCRTYNCLFFDNGSRLFEIRSNTVTLGEFKQFLDSKIKNIINNSHVRALEKYLQEQLGNSQDLLSIRDIFFEDIECDFSFRNNIYSSEWGYENRIIIGSDYSSKTRTEISELINNPPVDPISSKGLMLYYVVPEFVSPKDVKINIENIFKEFEKITGKIIPVMGLILFDTNNRLRDFAIELDVLDKLSNAEKQKYGTLVTNRISEIQEDVLKVLNILKGRAKTVYPIVSNKARFITGSIIYKEIYPKVIPFPLDGLRKNNSSATKTIDNFIELLSGDSTVWNDFTSLKTDDINRAKALLQNSWKIFNSKGDIERYPKNDGISSCFELLDSEIKKNGKLTIYQIYSTFLQPPYGCNSSQATLLTFVYLSGRNKKVELYQNNNQVTLNSLIKQNSAFSSKTKAIKETLWSSIVVVESVKDDARWYDLHDKWIKTANFGCLCDCFTEYKDLIKNNVSIPVAIIETISKLREKTEASIKCHDKWNLEGAALATKLKELIDNESDLYEIATSLFNYMYSFNVIVVNSKTIKNEEDIQLYKQNEKGAKEYISNNIEKWLNKNKPSDLNLFSKSFVEPHRQFKEVLTKLSLNEEAKKVEDQKNDLIEKYNVIKQFHNNKANYNKQYSSIESNVKYGLVSSTLAKKILVSICNLIGQIDNSNLSGLPDDFTYSDIKVKLIGLKNITEIKIKGEENFIKSLPSIKIETIDDIFKTDKQLDSALIFNDDASEIDKRDILEAAKKELDLLKKAYFKFSERNIGYAEIDSVYQHYADVLGNLEQAPIPYENILDNLKSSVVSSLEDLSISWIEKKQKEYNISQKSEDYLRLKNELTNLPDYLTSDDRLAAIELKNKINEKISELKVEYLLDQDIHLSSEEKKEFVEKIKALKLIDDFI